MQRNIFVAMHHLAHYIAMKGFFADGEGTFPLQISSLGGRASN
jgi:hypothetical protein